MSAVSTARHSRNAQGDLGWGNYAVRLLLSPDNEPSFQAASEERLRI